MFKKKFCPFCNKTLRSGKKIKASSYHYYFVCKNCRGGQLFPRPTKTDLELIYQSEKYFKNLSSKPKNLFLDLILSLKIFDAPAQWVEKRFRGFSILDVGCGNGEFLSYLKSKGWEVLGVDVSSVAVKETMNKIGRGNVRAGSFPPLKFNRKFDVISFWHVLEHLETPIDYLKKAGKVLDKKGVLVGEVPNFDSGVLKLFQKDYNWIMVPEHRLYFSKVALLKILERAGFAHVQFITTPRAVMNLSLSLNKFLVGQHVNKYIRWMVFSIFLLPSLAVAALAAYLGRGEVIRFEAYPK